MKFYDFVDKKPSIGRLVVVEGTEHLFAERALALIEETLLDPAMRDLNCDRFDASDLESMGPVAAACAAMPFLGPVRLVIVRRVEAMRAAPRRALWEIAQNAPAGNTLVLEDLQSPHKRAKPETFGQLAGRDALRIDTTAGGAARARYIREALAELDVTADSAVVAALAQAETSLIAVRTDLEKLALLGRRIKLDDLLQDSVAAKDVKAYRAAGALVEGRAQRALDIADELISAEGQKGAAAALLGAIASEYRVVWGLAKPGGDVPERMRWRADALRPVAKRLGERRARLAYERAIRNFEALVTGRADDLRTVIAVLAARAQMEGREPRGRRTTVIE